MAVRCYVCMMQNMSTTQSVPTHRERCLRCLALFANLSNANERTRSRDAGREGARGRFRWMEKVRVSERGEESVGYASALQEVERFKGRERSNKGMQEWDTRLHFIQHSNNCLRNDSGQHNIAHTLGGV